MWHTDRLCFRGSPILKISCDCIILVEIQQPEPGRNVRAERTGGITVNLINKESQKDGNYTEKQGEIINKVSEVFAPLWVWPIDKWYLFIKGITYFVIL